MMTWNQYLGRRRRRNRTSGA